MAHDIVILGGGVGGTLLANLLARRLPDEMAHVTVIDRSDRHMYQPNLLYIPFGEETPSHLYKDERHLLAHSVRLIVDDVTLIDTQQQIVRMGKGGIVPYDTLVIGTGAVLAPELVPGYADAAHHFYSEPAALQLKTALEEFDGGKLVVGVADIPYKCPPAPLEFVFKVEEYLTKRGLRDRTEITYLSPINRVFTIEPVSEMVTPMLVERGISYEVFFNVERIDPERRIVTSMEGAEIGYDLLVLVPPHRGSPVVTASGLGDEQGWLPTNRATLQVTGHENIYALGDATDIPVSKSGSTAHFEARVLADRITALVDPYRHHAQAGTTYNGRVLCFLETGYGQASQIAFDFQHPPVPPAPRAFYHYEKLLFNRVYWYLVPRGLV